MKIHHTNDDKPTYESVPACAGNGPRPRWKIVTDMAQVTCNRCRAIMGYEEVGGAPRDKYGCANCNGDGCGQCKPERN